MTIVTEGAGGTGHDKEQTSFTAKRQKQVFSLRYLSLSHHLHCLMT